MIPPLAELPITSLRILHLEDNARDAELIRDSLEVEGIACAIHRVQTREEFTIALDRGEFDLVLSDYTLPAFDGLSALRLARQQRPDTPFIFISGTIGEERAVESLMNGAVDYVLKDRLSRLMPAVQRALRETRDRAEHRRTQEKLRQRNELFRQITESVDDLIAVLDRDGRRVFVSASYARLFGDSVNLIGTDTLADIHPHDRERVRRIFQEAVDTGQSRRARFRFLLQDGSIRHIESQRSVMRDATGNVTNVVMVSRDVTEQEHAAMKIREQAALLDQAQDAIFVRDLDQRITYWNKGAERVYGWSQEEALGRRAVDLLYDPDSPQREEIWRTVFEQNDWLGESTHITKEGKEITVASRRTLLHDAHGKPAAILNINTDVTEKRQLETQFLRGQRLENIGSLAGGIAHDLNNILAPVLMATEILRDQLPDESSRELMDTVRASAQRGAELVHQILQFARGIKGEAALIQIRHLIKDFTKLVKSTFPRSIQIQTVVVNDLYLVMGDATQFHQVLLNLCVNARDAMPDGGTLTIEAANVVLEGKTFPGQGSVAPGKYVMLSVRDTGVGIPEPVREKIFQPFFTTKDQGKGTGLGLSTVAGIVQNHHGFIEVISAPSQGTTFMVYLPAAVQAEAPGAGTPQTTAPIGRGEHILLVEDEQALLEMTRELLEAYHYRVTSARDGAQAWLTFQTHRSSIDLVLTDLMMPVMDGPALIQAVKRISPAMPIVCVSGLSSEAKLAELNHTNVRALLQKPYTARDLLTTLHHVLASSGPR